MNINIATRLRMIDVVLFVVLALILAAITVSAQQSVTSNKAHKTKRSTASRAEKESPSATVTVLRNGKKVKRSLNPETERFDEPDAAMKAYVEKRLPKGAKELPLERYFTAKDHIKKMRRFSTSRGRQIGSQAETGDPNVDFSSNDTQSKFQQDGTSIQSLGATGGVLGTWQSIGPGNVGGRTRALIIDPNNANTMYAAGVAGGIWKSVNAGGSWAPLDDFMANIAVTCLAFEPGNSSVIYAGTGEGFFNADAVQGAGIFKSTDAGATWTRLGFTAGNVNFNFVNDIVVSNVNGQRVYAATRTGVWRSLDGGSTWAMILNIPTVIPSTTGVRGAMDLVMRTDQPTDYLFVAAGSAFNAGEPQSRIFRNTDAGNAAVVPMGTTSAAGSFTEVYTEPNMGRTSLAIAPSNQNVIYAMSDSFAAGNANLALLGVFRSTASGNPGSWTTQVRNTTTNRQDASLLSNPINFVLQQCGQSASNNILNQGWYDNVIAVDPTDSDKVWAGGTDLFRSDNGGVNWGVASYWWFTSDGSIPPANADTPQYAHADQHTIVFHPQYNGTSNQTMFVGNDGGIFQTDNAKVGNVGYTNGTTPSATGVTPASPICGGLTPGVGDVFPNPVYWASLNNGYSVTQFYHGLPYPNGQTYFGGTQDNGTNRGTDGAGPNQWGRIFGGDGGYVAVDPTNTNTLYVETTNLSFRKSTNGGLSFALRTTGIGEASSNFLFTAPFYMDPNNAQRLYIAGAFMWRTANAATNWQQASTFFTTRVSSIATAPTDSNFALAGTQTGRILRTSLATTATSTTVWPFTSPRTDFVSSVTFDPTNKNTAYATYSSFNSAGNVGHVWKSIDAGVTWTVIDGTGVNALPDIPAHVIVVDPNNTQRLYVGTDLGVFVTLDGGANWYQETTGFSNTVVESMSILNVSGVSTVYAFTHGRGAFKVSIPASCATVGTATPQAFASTGGTGTIGVTGVPTCTWNAVSNSPFITIDSANSGAGGGTLGFTVAPNNMASPRTGTMTIAGQTVTINQRAATTITWNNPADIIYGTALGSAQLNATANVPGTFIYTPGVGMVLSAGSGQALHVAFTPADSTNYDASSKDVLINVLKANLNYTASGSSQYSDPLSLFSIGFTGFVNNDPSSVVSGSPSCSTAATSTSAPGPYSVSCTNGSLTAANYNFSFSGGTYTVTQEDARATYAGQMYVSTSSVSSSSATVNLVATIRDISAVTGDPATDAYPGDVRNATVTFINRDTHAVLCMTSGIQLLDVSNLTAGTAGCQWSTDIGNVDSVSYTVGIVVGGYYTRDDSADNAVVTVSKLIPGSIGGGGFLINMTSAGATAGDVGARTHFGFNVRNNKSGSNFQGNVNFIVVSGGRTYQVKSTAINSLVIMKGILPAPSTASFSGKGVITDITNPNSPVTVEGNALIQIAMTDAGEPGSSDTLALTLWDKHGALWFSSNWTGTRTIEQLLGGGNLQVR